MKVPIILRTEEDGLIGELLIYQEVDESFQKQEKVYLKPGEEPPKGETLQTGPKGGKYYDPKGRFTAIPKYSPKAQVNEEFKQSLEKILSFVPPRVLESVQIHVLSRLEMPRYTRAGKEYVAGAVQKDDKILLSDAIPVPRLVEFVAHELAEKLYENRIVDQNRTDEFKKLIEEEGLINEYAENAWEKGKEYEEIGLPNIGIGEQFSEIAVGIISDLESTENKFPKQVAFVKQIFKEATA